MVIVGATSSRFVLPTLRNPRRALEQLNVPPPSLLSFLAEGDPESEAHLDGGQLYWHQGGFGGEKYFNPVPQSKQGSAREQLLRRDFRNERPG